MTDVVPAKRRRTDEQPGESTEVAPVIDERLWYDDGNIVVSAGTKPGRLFKCHRSVLTKNSEVFSEMFSFPFSSMNEMYDGVPCVRLPDPEDDVRMFLTLLYDVT